MLKINKMTFFLFIISAGVFLYSCTFLLDSKKSLKEDEPKADSEAMSITYKNKDKQIKKIDTIINFPYETSGAIAAHNANRLPHVPIEDRFKFGD